MTDYRSDAVTSSSSTGRDEPDFDIFVAKFDEFVSRIRYSFDEAIGYAVGSMLVNNRSYFMALLLVSIGANPALLLECGW